MTPASKCLAPYTDLFLSTKKKYKPVAKKVHPVIGELPEKFRIECKIIGNPLNNLPVLNPNPPPFIPTAIHTHCHSYPLPFIPTDCYTLE
jgi:hypothetical protein